MVTKRKTFHFQQYKRNDKEAIPIGALFVDDNSSIDKEQLRIYSNSSQLLHHLRSDRFVVAENETHADALFITTHFHEFR